MTNPFTAEIAASQDSLNNATASWAIVAGNATKLDPSLGADAQAITDAFNNLSFADALGPLLKCKAYGYPVEAMNVAVCDDGFVPVALFFECIVSATILLAAALFGFLLVPRGGGLEGYQEHEFDSKYKEYNKAYDAESDDDKNDKDENKDEDKDEDEDEDNDSKMSDVKVVV